MNILFTSVAISQLKCLDYAFFVAKMSKMTFTRFGGQVWLNGGQVRQFWGRDDDDDDDKFQEKLASSAA